MPNKVKFGLKNVYYAKATFDDDENVSYAAPTAIPGAVNLSLSSEGEPEPFYADNIVYYMVSNNNGYSGDLEIALVPESFAQDILHEELDTNGVMLENAENELEHFALLFEFDGDSSKTHHVLYNCSCSRPNVEGKTKEDTKTPQTETLALTAVPLANGYVKAKTSSTASDEAYSGWFDAVYMPTEATEAVSG